jgi:hypothetical protein
MNVKRISNALVVPPRCKQGGVSITQALTYYF